MDAAWIGVIGTLLGGALVGTLGMIGKRIELKYQYKENRRTDRLEQIDALHVGVSQLFVDLAGLRGKVLKIHHYDNVPLADRILRTSIITDEVSSGIGRLNSLQRIYAPEARKAWGNFVSSTTNVFVSMVEFGTTANDDPKARAKSLAFDNSLEDCLTAGHIFLSRLEELRCRVSGEVYRGTVVDILPKKILTNPDEVPGLSD